MNRRKKLDDYEDAEFPLFVTPIVLAAKLHRVEIIKLLINEKHSEIHPLIAKSIASFRPYSCTGMHN